jgi:glutaconate CoA-transferase subunit A
VTADVIADGPAHTRTDRLASPADAVALVRDGMTVAVGGFINSGHPMALVRQLIRDRRRDLTIVGAASAGLDVDLLIAAGVARKVVTPYVGAEGLAAIGPAFRRAAQAGELETYELDEAHYYAGLRAAAQRLPFNPWRAGVGTSLPEVNPELKLFRDPIKNELLLAIPAIEVDVCLLHVARSDAYGNAQHVGTRYGDPALFAAADRTIVSVEQVVPSQTIRANPAATSIPGADLVVRAQYGAHPFSAEGSYRPDAEHLREYLAAANDWLKTGSRGRLDEYLDRYVFDAPTHEDYLARIGVDRLLGLHEF